MNPTFASFPRQTQLADPDLHAQLTAPPPLRSSGETGDDSTGTRRNRGLRRQVNICRARKTLQVLQP